MVIHTTTLDTMEKVIAIYGGTTWIKIEGMFLLGQSSSYAINSTGGSATHTLTTAQLPNHTHSIPALSGTAANGGNHTHTTTAKTISNAFIISDAVLKWGGKTQVTGGTGGHDGVCGDGNPFYIDIPALSIASSGAHSHSVTTTASTSGSTGSADAHNNMPPYKTVYIWERTA